MSLSVLQQSTLVNSLIKYLYVFIITGFVFKLLSCIVYGSYIELKHLGTRIRNKKFVTENITSKWKSGSLPRRSVRFLSIRISACAEIIFNTPIVRN